MSSKSKGLKVVIDLSLFHARIIVLIGDYKSVKKHIPKFIRHQFKDRSYHARCVYYRHPQKDDSMVLTNIIHSKSGSISSIAHEAVHAGTFLLTDIGCSPDADNGELLAHLVQEVCRKVEFKLDCI